MNGLLEETANDKIVASAGVPSLEKCRFIYGAGMQKQWVASSTIFLDFVGSRCGQSVKASLEAGELVVTEVDAKYLKKFETEKDEKDYLAGLKHWEQKMHKQTEENYNKCSIVIY